MKLFFKSISSIFSHFSEMSVNFKHHEFLYYLKFHRVGESNDDTIRERLHHQAAPRPHSPKVIPASPAISSSNSSNSTPVLTPSSNAAINGPFLFPMSRSANHRHETSNCAEVAPSNDLPVGQLVTESGDEELLLCKSISFYVSIYLGVLILLYLILFLFFTLFYLYISFSLTFTDLPCSGKRKSE